MTQYRRIYAIGDVHGNYNDLCTILAHIRADRYDAMLDALVFLGDLVDSHGPADAAKVVKHVREVSEGYEDVYVLRGNHEQLLIDAQPEYKFSPYHQIWWQQGGQYTYESYIKEYHYEPDTLSLLLDVPKQFKSDVIWMKSLPTLIEIDDYYFVHAGLWPDRPAVDTNDYDRMWLRNNFLNSDYDWGKVVVHGHTSRKLPEVRPNRINIDTTKKAGRVSGVRLQEGKEPLFFDKYGSFPLEEGTER